MTRRASSTSEAEELGKSTFGGVTVTVMVHVAMASPHLLHGGTPELAAPSAG